MAHHAMRRQDRQTTEAEAWDILARGHYCVLGTVDADGTPYGVPISYALQGRELVIHTTAQDGHLLENFGRDPRVCATVVATAPAFLEDPGISEAYESVIARGTIRRVTDPVEHKQILVALCLRYDTNREADVAATMRDDAARTATWALSLEELSGKRRTTLDR